MFLPRPGGQPAVQSIEGPSVVGELSFVDGGPRSTTLRAVSDGELRRLSLESFEVLAAREPELARAILLDVARILSRGARHDRFHRRVGSVTGGNRLPELHADAPACAAVGVACRARLQRCLHARRGGAADRRARHRPGDLLALHRPAPASALLRRARAAAERLYPYNRRLSRFQICPDTPLKPAR